MKRKPVRRRLEPDFVARTPQKAAKTPASARANPFAGGLSRILVARSRKTGGVLTAGPLSATVGGVVVRIGAHVIRLAMPLSIVRSTADGTDWEVRARSLGHRVHIVGHASHAPHVLPVPVPAERRNADTDFEHLAGHLRLTVSGRVEFSGETELAGLEIGHRPEGVPSTS